MSVEAWLAVAHHLAVFTLLGTLAAEWGLLRPGLSVGDVARLGRIDAASGASAATVLVVGVLRVAFGDKTPGYYTGYVVFWLKMASFATVGLLSIRPTLRYLAWRRAEEPPSDEEVGAARRYLHLQLMVFPLIPIFAALMARGVGR